MDKEPLTPQKAFLAAVSQYAKPGSSSAFRVGDATIALTDGVGTPLVLSDNEVYLLALRADQPGQGQGSRALQILGGLADLYNVDIIASAVVTSKGTAAELARLHEFYKKNGFVQDAVDKHTTIRYAHPVAGENGPVM